MRNPGIANTRKSEAIKEGSTCWRRGRGREPELERGEREEKGELWITG